MPSDPGAVSEDAVQARLEALIAEWRADVVFDRTAGGGGGYFAGGTDMREQCANELAEALAAVRSPGGGNK